MLPTLKYTIPLAFKKRHSWGLRVAGCESAPGAGLQRMIRVSVILPTRGRVSAVRSLLANIQETVSNPESIEVVLCMDEDDTDSLAVASKGFGWSKS